MNRFRRFDWDAAAVIVAAVAALLLDLLHIIDQAVVLAITLVILSLLLLRDLRAEERDERATAALDRMEASVVALRVSLTPPDVILIGPGHLRAESERFARDARGEMTWFNVCLLMFVPQPLFDVLLRPAIENPRVTELQFILDRSEQERWRTAVMPKVAACRGHEKVREPVWRELRESVSFILAEEEPAGLLEAHLSFWGEPFMSHSTTRQLPRYIFRVQGHSELIARFVDMQRTYRMQPD